MLRARRDIGNMTEIFALEEPYLPKALLWARALRRRTIDYWWLFGIERGHRGGSAIA